MSTDPTTDRAQRRQAVASGERDTGIESVDRRSPGAGLAAGTSRSRQLATQREIAGEIEVDREGVATTDRVGGGMTAFLRSPGASEFAANLRADFAGAADFVTQQDVAPNVDRQQISAAPEVAPDRRDDVADRARSETASDAQFIEPADLSAAVGGRGVTELEVAENRRDDVAERTRQGLASDDPFAQPSDFSADVSAQGVESAGLTDPGARRRAARQFESETPLSEVDPSADVTATGDGFGLDSDAQRRVAARQFEAETPVFGDGELSPDDVRDTGDGFGLAEGPAREVAAEQLSAQIDGSVAPDAIELEPTGDGGFEAIFERGQP